MPFVNGSEVLKQIITKDFFFFFLGSHQRKVTNMCGWSFIEAAAACLWVISLYSRRRTSCNPWSWPPEGDHCYHPLFIDDKVYGCHKLVQDERIPAEIGDLLSSFFKCFIGWYIFKFICLKFYLSYEFIFKLCELRSP